MKTRNLFLTLTMLLVLVMVSGCEPQAVRSATLDPVTVEPVPTDTVRSTAKVATTVPTAMATARPTASATPVPTRTPVPPAPTPLPPGYSTDPLPELTQVPLIDVPPVVMICTIPKGYRPRDLEFDSELRDVEVYNFDIIFDLEKYEVQITPRDQPSYVLPICDTIGCDQTMLLQYHGENVAKMKYWICDGALAIKMEMMPYGSN